MKKADAGLEHIQLRSPFRFLQSDLEKRYVTEGCMGGRSIRDHKYQYKVHSRFEMTGRWDRIVDILCADICSFGIFYLKHRIVYAGRIMVVKISELL